MNIVSLYNPGSSTSFTEALHKPAFLSDDELKHIILEVWLALVSVLVCVHQ